MLTAWLGSLVYNVHSNSVFKDQTYLITTSNEEHKGVNLWLLLATETETDVSAS